MLVVVKQFLILIPNMLQCFYYKIYTFTHSTSGAGEIRRIPKNLAGEIKRVTIEQEKNRKLFGTLT